MYISASTTTTTKIYHKNQIQSTEISRLFRFKCNNCFTINLISIINIAKYFNNTTGTNINLNHYLFLVQIQISSQFSQHYLIRWTYDNMLFITCFQINHISRWMNLKTKLFLYSDSIDFLSTLLTVPIILTGLPENCWIIDPLIR